MRLERKINNFFDKLLKLKIFNVRFLPILIALLVLGLSIGYSSLNENIFAELAIEYEPQSDIRITNISLVETSDSDTISNSETYVKDRVSINTKMPNSNSYIIYNVSITNYGNVKEGIYNITSSNENIKVETLNYNMKDPLCESEDYCTLGSIVNLQIKISYNENKYDNQNVDYTTNLNFDFRGYSSITYSNLVLTNPVTTIMTGDTITINLENNNYTEYLVTSDKGEVDYEYDMSNNNLIIRNIPGDITVKGVNYYAVNYNNITFEEYSPIEEVREESNLITHIPGNEIESLTITMGNTTLTSDQYSYSDDDILTVNNVTGPVTITNNPINNVINPPDLYDNTLVPIAYDETSSSWKIVSSSNNNNEWYDYNNQKWANAAVLAEGVSHDVGTLVNDSTDMLQMYVWIPRYSYSIDGEYGHYINNINALSPEIDHPGAINIKFTSVDTIDTGDARYTGMIGDTWRTHPAFQLQEDDDSVTEISGIWIGKFALSGTSGNYKFNCSEASCTTYNEVRILPNLSFSNSNNILSYYYGITSMINSDNIFGFNANKVDPHMIKNSEWGAMAYLFQSIYGKYGNKNYSENKKIKGINSSNLTGNSTKDEINYEYKNSNSYSNTTTGNIYGIYDLTSDTIGTMSYLITSETEKYNIPQKHRNIYNSSYSFSLDCGINDCYGQALNETIYFDGWYSLNDLRITSDYSFISRCGGRFTNNFSVFMPYIISSTDDSATYVVLFKKTG